MNVVNWPMSRLFLSYGRILPRFVTGLPFSTPREGSSASVGMYLNARSNSVNQTAMRFRSNVVSRLERGFRLFEIPIIFVIARNC